MYKKIMVATDGSVFSEKSVATAIELASVLKSDLIVLKVAHRYLQSYFEGSVLLSQNDVLKIENYWAEVAKNDVDLIVKAAEERGVPAKAVVVKSEVVSDAIISAAKKFNVDLIVMASHGRNGIKRLLLGSESQQVLTHTDISVLIIHL